MYKRNRRYRKPKSSPSAVVFPILIIIFIAAVAVAVRYMMIYAANSEKDNPDTGLEETQNATDNIYLQITEEPTTEEVFDDSYYMTLIDMSRVYSRNIFMIRASDKKIQLNILGDERIFPASMTKIMTALVCIDNISDMNEEITVPESIFPYLTEQNAAVAGFLANEKVKAKDLLYGVMLPSGADACLALAVKIAGSEEAFAELMNKKAREIGLSETHFVNSTGLHDINHYSTSRDIAKLLDYAMQNTTAYSLLTAEKYYTSPTDLHPDGMTLISTMYKNLEGIELTKCRILGGKTGYTGEAGYCLASFAEVNGEKYILVTAGAQSEEPIKIMSQLDAAYIYESEWYKTE